LEVVAVIPRPFRRTKSAERRQSPGSQVSAGYL